MWRGVATMFTEIWLLRCLYLERLLKDKMDPVHVAYVTYCCGVFFSVVIVWYTFGISVVLVWY